ncbi:hypothetical protein ACTXT7_005713 [Hymenolepis weldensis]
MTDSSYVCKVEKKPIENKGDELATSKRKQYCQRSADSLRTSKFVRGVHGMMDENPGKSIQYLAKDLQMFEGIIRNYTKKPSPGSKKGHKANTNADAYVEALQTIFLKPSWIGSVANVGRAYIFQEDFAPCQKALKTQDRMA